MHSADRTLIEQKVRSPLRVSQLCTAEVAALCLDLAGDRDAAEALDAYLDVFTDHYLGAKHRRPVDAGDEAHRRLSAFLPAGG